MLNNTIILNKLEKETHRIYHDSKIVLSYHDWSHIDFVRHKTAYFSREIEANSFIAESSAIVHDINYVVEINSPPEVGKKLRKKILFNAGYCPEDIAIIEKTILDAHTGYRSKNKNISKESMALSDADTLFKSLPITPVLFAHQYMSENNISLKELAIKIVSEQELLMSNDIYFYTNIAKKNYSKWAKTNIHLWKNIVDSLNDESICDLISNKNKNISK